ncbi:MAG: LacI family DNA-binding transcriptional regulator [Intrasporangium sp.]|uniref:LacI family DNA-binding transcriptional regulator n=1 Tax=Intrasporangium sp. TaxID=1925024 RepID=UPI003F7DE7B0
MQRRPTIYDVAEAAGVSASTVSRAFARPGRVNADTAAHIFEVAKQLGYRTSALPGVTTARTRTLALVVTDITNPFYAEIIRGAHEAAGELGYTILLSHTQEDAQLEREWTERELSGVDGVLLTSSRMSDSAIRMMAKQKPLIVLNRALPEVPSLLVDNARGVRRALEHVGELGHRSVLYLAGPETSWTDGTRWQALREAAHELQVRVRRIDPHAPPTLRAGQAVAEQVARHEATAVIAYNDVLAIGLMHGLRALGVRVPEDLSVVGFDDTLLAEIVQPQLTTVAAPLHALGTAGVRNLVAMVRGAVPSREPRVLPIRLVVRGSTAQRRRNSTSPARGTTKTSGSASAAATSIDAGSR